MQGNKSEAESLYKRSMSIYQNDKTANNLALANVMENYRDLLRSSGRTAEADALTQNLNARIAQSK
jgi:hypothetical protein